jgi:dinuclear metal center YbgI/SA1388 family protein
MKKIQVSRERLAEWFEDTLSASHFKDYCPNGLQIQGAAGIGLLACAVTASVNAIEAAAKMGAQALVVHHGYFWRGEDSRIVGLKHRRIDLLMRHRINLFAYHLPLDVHPELGNNAQLGRKMGWSEARRFGDQQLICLAEIEKAQTASQLARQLQKTLHHAPLLVGNLERPIHRIAWCTGAAQDSLEEAIAAGCDAYVSGEISERTTHIAREAGVIYAAAGHHASERFGVQALAEAASQSLKLRWAFIDDPNPV